ncbi:MAG: DUF3987 domain-containing protein [Caulobacteraceae bacterium]|nr:DUF3987 domain-containing protein [Caulobacteraceae bacterium]
MRYANLERIAADLPVVEGDWDDPDRSFLDGGLVPPPALPLEHFGSWGRWLEGFARSVSAPVDYAAAGLLAGAAAAVGAARKVRAWGEWSEFPALWVLLMGPPSASKSPAYAPVVSVLKELEREESTDLDERRRHYETKKREADAVRAIWEDKVKDAVKSGGRAPLKPTDADEPEEPRAPRITVSDVTVESLAPLFKNNPRGLVACRDELSGLVGNFNKYGGDGDAAMFLERYNGHALSVDRVKAGHIRADIALLSIFGGIQPERFTELILKRADDGLVSRFLLFYPGPVVRVRPVNGGNLPHLKSALSRLRNLPSDIDQDGRFQPRALPLTPGALDVFEEWWKANGEAGAEASGFMAGTIGKGAGIVLRLALLLELLEWAYGQGAPEPAAVTEQSLSAACFLFDDYFCPMSARVFGGASRDPYEVAATHLLKHIRQAGDRTVNTRELRRRRVAGLKKADDMERAINVLAEGGWLKFAGGRDGEREGRQRNDWLVNPTLWEGRP